MSDGHSDSAAQYVWGADTCGWDTETYIHTYIQYVRETADGSRVTRNRRGRERSNKDVRRWRCAHELIGGLGEVCVVRERRWDVHGVGREGESC